ncbi:MAG: phosphotransferase, partial [Candidatus Merdivicinus sp.]
TVAEEIEFILERAPFTTILADAYAAGGFPLRVTHNDTKLNNIMFDGKTRKPLCILDLDTVMPGFSATDFGDAIRFGANTAEEDERDLSIVHFDLSMYQAFAEGFLAGCGDILTQKEISLLPSSAKLITLENSMRFLADYLEGDHYYHTSRPGQNLDRCRTHLKLVWEMEQQWKQMNDIIAEIRKNKGEKK